MCAGLEKRLNHAYAATLKQHAVHELAVSAVDRLVEGCQDNVDILYIGSVISIGIA